MDLLNRTGAAAAFVNTIVAEDRLLGAVAIKTVFRIVGGQLVRDHERAWPAGGDPVKTEFGEIEGDSPFLRGGVDLMVLGKAYVPEGRGYWTQVSVRAGSLVYDMYVIGDRIWQKTQGGELTPSYPVPFESMPLSWDRAYGGKAKVETGELPWGANPVGRGFYMDAAAAEGQPLPNIEDPANPVRTWQTQPEPRGVAPYDRTWMLRLERAADIDLTGPRPRITRINPEYFNNANPRLVLKPPPAAGEAITVTNVRPRGGACSFVLPDLSYHVYVQLQDRAYVFPAHLEAIIVLVEEERVVLAHKCGFRYRMVPLERRAAVLYEGKAPERPPLSYHIIWQEAEVAAEAEAGA